MPKLPFNSSVVQGIRTPCLQGNRDAMWPVWQEVGFTYDASNTGSLGWPKKIDGFEIWEFPLQTIPVVGFDRGALFHGLQLHVHPERLLDARRSA